MTETVKETKLEQCNNCLKHTMLTMIIDDESDVFKQCCCNNCGCNQTTRQKWDFFDENFMSKKEIDSYHKRFSPTLQKEEHVQ